MLMRRRRPENYGTGYPVRLWALVDEHNGDVAAAIAAFLEETTHPNAFATIGSYLLERGYTLEGATLLSAHAPVSQIRTRIGYIFPKLRPQQSTQWDSRAAFIRKKGEDAWRVSRPARGTIVKIYLVGCRKLNSAFVDQFWFHPGLHYDENHPSIPAMLTRYVNDNGTPGPVKATFLKADGSDKIDFGPARKTFGPIKGAWIPYGTPPSGEPWVIGEGCETVLSVRQVMGYAVASIGGHSSFPGILVPPVDTRSTIYIAADGDDGGASRPSIRQITTDWKLLGYTVLVAWPPKGTDFNQLLRDGRHDDIRKAFAEAAPFVPTDEERDRADDGGLTDGRLRGLEEELGDPVEAVLTLLRDQTGNGAHHNNIIATAGKLYNADIPLDEIRAIMHAGCADWSGKDWGSYDYRDREIEQAINNAERKTEEAAAADRSRPQRPRTDPDNRDLHAEEPSRDLRVDRNDLHRRQEAPRHDPRKRRSASPP